MTSEQLADQVKEIVAKCQSRVVGTGNDQYSLGDIQKFETLDNTQLINWALEEVQDLINYAVMLHIKLERVKDGIRD